MEYKRLNLGVLRSRLLSLVITLDLNISQLKMHLL